MKYKYLFLDLDDTVFNSRSLYDDAIKMSWHHFRKFHDITYEKFEKLFLETRKELKKEYYHLTISHNRAVLFMSMMEKLDLRFDAELVKELYDIYWTTVNASILPFPNVINILEKVNQNGITIVAISDGSLLSRLEKIESLDLSHYFRYLVSSEEVVKTKPESDIFKLALKKCGAKKSEVLFVGNSLTSDIVGREKFGIDTVWFNPDGSRISKDIEERPSYVIKNFEELIDILEI